MFCNKARRRGNIGNTLQQMLKSPAVARLSYKMSGLESDSSYVNCSRTFLAVLNFELNVLAFSQSFEAVTLDCREVYEHVFRAIVRSDEAEAFVSVEPFYDTSHFTGHSELPLKKLVSLAA